MENQTIRRATLVRGSETPVGEGKTGPTRALARIDEEPTFALVVKRIPERAVAAECFAALLLRAWGVPVPEPFLVVDGGALLFGSKDDGYPNLKQRMGFDDALPQEVRDQLIEICAKIVSRFPETPLALVADEAIDNRDRNLGNVLWDGASVAFVDHERAFGLQADQDLNKLAILATIAGEAEQVERAAVTLALTLSGELVREVSESCGVDSQEYADYVAQRVKNVATRVLTRFPKPVDLLTGNHE